MRAVNRIFSIFDAFTAEHPRLTLQDICDRIGLSKATSFRLVNSLCDAGYLVRLQDHRYCLSMKVVKLAGVVAGGLSVRDAARSIMAQIGETTGETVSLNAVVGADRVCIDVVEAVSPLSHIVKVGEHAPLFYGATGKVLLAHLPQKEQAAVLQAVPPGFPLNARELKQVLDEIFAQHYAITGNERVAGSLAISVAIFDMDNKGTYALTLTGPEARMRQQLKRNLSLMLRAQREISTQLGADEKVP